MHFRAGKVVQWVEFLLCGPGARVQSWTPQSGRRQPTPKHFSPTDKGMYGTYTK